MPYSSGTYTLVSGNPPVSRTTITVSWAQSTLNDIATALSTCVLKDGTQTITANIPMSNYRITGLGAATAVTDAAQAKQVQNCSFVALTTVTGSNTIAGTATPTPTAYAIGQVFYWIQPTTNTGAATLNVSTLGAKNLYKDSPAGLVACVAGDLVGGNNYFARYDTAGSTQFVVLNPTIPGTVGAGKTGAGTGQSDGFALVDKTTEFTTVASGSGATLPLTGVGAEMWVYNGGANALKIYPDSGAQINGLTTNIGISLTTATSIAFRRVTATRWIGILSH